MPGYYGQVLTTEKFSSKEESPSVAAVVGKPDTITEYDDERINAEINLKGMVTAEMRKERATKGINSHNIKIPDFSLPKKSGLILIENDVLSTLAEIDDGVNSGSISRHLTTADLEKVAEPKRLAETETLYYHKSSILDSTLPKIPGLSFKDNKSPSKPAGSGTCLRGDNKGRSYRSDNNYPTYSDHVQGVKGDQVQGPKCNHSARIKTQSRGLPN